MHKTFRRVAAAALAAASIYALSPLDRSTAAETFPTNGRMAQQWAAPYMSGKVPADADVESIARRFPVLAIQQGSFTKPQIDRMRAVNPNLSLLVYINGSFAQSSQAPGSASGYPESWYAKDAKGAHPYSRNFHNWLMRMWSPEWQADRARACTDAIAKIPDSNGCFVDMLGVAPIHGTYMSTIPVNDSGAKWTDQAWMAQTGANMNNIAAKNPSALVMGTGLSSGRYYFSLGTDQLLLNSAASGAMSELWGRQATDKVTTYKSEATWKQDVDMLVDAASKGKSVFATVKLWVSNTPAQAKSWHAYTLGSFLLGTDGKQFYNFSTAKTTAGITDAQPTFNAVDVGTPLGAYSKPGCYVREFSKGFSAVNPTKASCTASVPAGSFTDLDGSSVAGGANISLAPNTATVLTKS
jgi:hypothetical protein